MALTIPKKIMQTWKTDTIPDKWRDGQLSVRSAHGSWDYSLMTDKDNEAFCKEHFPQYYSFFVSLPYGIQRADMIRYMWLYINGGLYIDLDYLVKEPLDQLFTQKGQEGGHRVYLVDSANSSKYVTNSIMASTAKNPFWLSVLEECVRPVPWYVVTKDWVILHQTGPSAVTRAFESDSKRSSHVTIIPHSLVHPCSSCDDEATCSVKSEYSFLKQLEGESWISSYFNHYKSVYCWIRKQNWFTLFVLIFVAAFILAMLFTLLYKAKCCRV